MRVLRGTFDTQQIMYFDENHLFHTHARVSSCQLLDSLSKQIECGLLAPNDLPKNDLVSLGLYALYEDVSINDDNPGDELLESYERQFDLCHFNW